LLPAEIGAHVAAAVGLLLAGFDQRGAIGLQAIVAGAAFELVGPLQHRSGDVAQVLDHVDAAAWRGRQFVGQRLREEAVGKVVVFRRGIVLERARHTVVIGRDQTLRRQEGGRTATQRSDRGERRALEIAQRLGIELEAGGLHLVGDRAGLARQPHALVGVHRGRGREQQGRSPGKQDFLHCQDHASCIRSAAPAADPTFVERARRRMAAC